MYGCAPAAISPARVPSDAEVQELEARLARDSSSIPVLVSLGQAYQLRGRPTDVVPLLERARALRPDDTRVGLLLGIAYEDSERLDEAGDLYRAYIANGQDPALRRHLDGRLRVLRQRQLVLSVREAIGRETQLAATPPTPTTVAVFPFLIQTQDTTLQPLGRALAEMLVTDLSQTERLTVLERLQVQLLINEIQLAEQGLVDPATAARGGRLLGAGQVVQGSVAGTEEALQLDAAVVGVTTAAPNVQSAQTSTSIQRLFDAEKALALEIFRVLGIELTAAERERVNRRPTENVRALLAFGLGLEAEDVGAWMLASQYYAQAVSFDPTFVVARDRAAAAARAAEAAATSTSALWQRANTQGVDALAEAEAMVPEMDDRDAVAELFGQEGLTGSGSVIRILLSGGGGV
jgi:TolB-like protein